jgi:hypothetical protein
MNSIPVVAGDPLFEEWIYFVSWRYNGCKGCSAQEGKYRDGTLLLLEEMGAEFWQVNLEDPCPLIPGAGATIEEDGDCYRASGPAEYWRDESAGHGGALQWTKTTDSEEASNYGTWRLRFEEAGEYELAVFTDANTFGTSTQAAYVVSHAAGDDTVVVDQSAAEGWLVLGSFTFETADGYQVRLGDNTGEEWAEEPGGKRIMFDALRVAAVAGGSNTGLSEPTAEESGGGCSVSTRGQRAWWPFLLLLLAFTRRLRLLVTGRRSRRLAPR